MIIVGHRGAAGLVIENTLESVEAAISLGVDMVEIDVHSIQGQLVVFHDFTTTRLINVNQRLKDLTITEIEQMDVLGHKIPLLEDVIKQVNGRVKLNIELKGFNTSQALLALFRKMEITNYDNYIISSFNHVELDNIRRENSRIPIGVLLEGQLINLAHYAKELSAKYLIVNHHFATKACVNDAHNKGLLFFVYTVNNLNDFDDMKNMGVDGIITDYPNYFMGGV